MLDPGFLALAWGAVSLAGLVAAVLILLLMGRDDGCGACPPPSQDG